MDSNKLDSPPPGKSRSSRTCARCSHCGSRTHNSSQTCARSGPTTSAPSMSSSAVSPARTCRPWAHGPGSLGPEQASSGRYAGSSRKYGPSGRSLKTSLACSLAMVGKTLASSSGPLPTAGMWDSGGCLMLSISESPSVGAGFSWSLVLDDNPPLGCFLTPRQWTQYLARLARSKSHGQRMDGLPIAFWPKALPASSLSVRRLSSVTKEDGVRWLSGPESLKLQGFEPGWMRPITEKLGRPETRSVFPWPAGSPST